MHKTEFAILEERTYFGGKGLESTYKTIINQLPIHKTYAAGFAGHDALTRFKKPARFNIVIDRDPKVIQRWNEAQFPTRQLTPHNLAVLQTDFLTLDLPCFHQPTTLLYLDPPYLPDTRTSRKQYNFELSVEQHKQLLAKANQLECMIAISCYDHELYKEVLSGWRKIQFEAITRGGTTRTETLYMNFPAVPPNQLHDKRFIGDNYRTREVTKRRLETIKKKINKLSEAEKGLLFEQLREEFPNQFHDQVPQFSAVEDLKLLPRKVPII